MKYEHTVYSKGFVLRVNPPDRAMDLIHYITTGHLLGGRSLDDVEYEFDSSPTSNEAAAKLRKWMHVSGKSR